MNNKVNYTLVGIVVLVGMTLMAAFAYWMLKPSSDEEMQKYLIYFDESVLGLNIDAPVKYRGITVGKVIRLRINPKNSEQVEVLVDILKSTPIKENTVAKLTAQGITGLSYINLTQGENDAPPLRAKKGQKYPVIKSVPSFFEHFERSLGDVSSQFTETLARTQQLLNEKNQEQIALLLQKTASIAAKLDRVLDNKTIDSFHESMENVEQIIAGVNAVVPQVDAFIQNSIAWEKKINGSFSSIEKTYLNMDKTMEDMALSFRDSAMTFEKMSYNINNTMLESQNLMVELQNTLNHLNNNPSALLYERRALRKDPGEK